MSYLERAKAEFKEQEEQDNGLVANLLDIPVGAVSGMINAANAVADLPGDVGNLLGILSEEEAKEFKGLVDGGAEPSPEMVSYLKSKYDKTEQALLILHLLKLYIYFF